MSKKKNKTIKVVAVAVVIIAVLAVIGIAWYTGLINMSFMPSGDDSLTPAGLDACLVDLHASKIEIFTALETLMNQDLDFAIVSPYIDALHMKIYGNNCYTALPTMEVYEADYALDGWTSLEGGRESVHGIGWFAYYEIWGKLDQGRFIASGEGSIVYTTYGYNCVILTAYGALTTAEQFLDECGG